MDFNDDPEWWKKTTIYQVYPRSFQDSNGDGIGDLKGIISRLDYLQGLGIETIWFSPFHKSPQKDWGYDASDHTSIDPEYGTMEEFELLVSEIHRRGMRIVLDMVLNHTSDQHPWFLESKSSKSNPKRDWYIWRKGKGPGKAPNNWQSFIEPNGWNYDPTTDEWFFTSFLRFQPDLNYHNPEVKKAMFDVCRFWLRKGVDGFRLDIFNAIYKDPAFPDNPFTFQIFPTETDQSKFFQHPKYNLNHPKCFELAKDLRRAVDEEAPPTRFLIGEIGGDDDVLISFLGHDKTDGLNLVFMFELLKINYCARFFHEIFDKFESLFGDPMIPVAVYGNHDQRRYMSKINNDVNKAKMLAVFQLTIRAVPVIYQGEEIGMTQAPFRPMSETKDPLPHVFSWLPSFIWRIVSSFGLNRDLCRTPMQWDKSSHNAGFTSPEAEPWLPVQLNYDKINVQDESEDPESLLNCYRSLLHLRKLKPSLYRGTATKINIGRSWVFWSNSQILAFERRADADVSVVIMNFSNSWFFGTQTIELPIRGCSHVLFSTQKTLRNLSAEATELHLLPGQAVILGNQKIKSF